MRFPQLVQALRDEGELPLRDVFVRFEETGPPDVLGPPRRWPIIQQIIDDTRLFFNRDAWTVRLR